MDEKNIIEDVTSSEYKYGFTTEIETDVIPIGLNEDVVRIISAKKNEPDWMLDFRRMRIVTGKQIGRAHV